MAPAGEEIAARLRELVTDPARALVLIVGTARPRTGTAAPANGRPDSHAQARTLLTGNGIEVPATFESTAMAALRDTTDRDARLSRALAEAVDGEIMTTQTGGPSARAGCFPR